MTLTHVSLKNPNRVYVRKFDHDEARMRHRAGESIAALAREYGVTTNAVWWVVSDKAPAQREQAEQRAYSAKCDDCGAPMHRGSRYSGSTRCVECGERAQATNVRSDTLRCETCKEWKPDADFPFNAGGRKHHRGRHSQCRVCQTKARREHRQRNREADNAYQREYRRRKNWEQKTLLQRATARVRPEGVA